MPAVKERKKDFAVVLPAELAERYEDLKKDLGAGGFAKVILAEHIITKEKVAIKVMNKAQLAKKDDLHRAYNEVHALKHLGHQHISKMYEVFETKDYIYLVMEYCPGGELFDYIVSRKRLPEKEARDVFRQIASAVAFIHDNGYAHRDLKPENMLLDRDSKIKIIDFGLSAKPKEGLTSPLHTRAGSALYASPELISGEAYYGDETDVWSLGVVLYALLCGFLPFDHSNTVELYKKIKKGEFATPPWLSSGSIKLLSQMLDVHPTSRIPMINILKHEWICNGFDEAVDFHSEFTNTLNSDVVKILAEYYQWTSSETKAKILEYNYDGLTAIYYILCSMSDKLLQKFCSTCLGGNDFTGETLLSVPHQENASNGTHNASEKVTARPRAKTIDFHFEVGEQNRTIVEKPTVEKPTEETSSAESYKPRSKTIKHKSETTDAESRPRGILKHNDDSSTDVRRRSTVSTGLSKNNDSAVIINDRAGRKKKNPSCVVTTPAGQQTKVKDNTWKIWHTAESNLKKTKRLTSSCNDALDEPSTDTDTTETQYREVRPRTSSMKEFTKRLSGLFKHDEKPRRVKAIYHVENTSTLSPDEVREELERVLDFMVKSSLLKSFHNPEKYLFKCKANCEKKTVFELEVCWIPMMDNVVGIRRKRLKGDAWKYKELVEKVLSNAKV